MTGPGKAPLAATTRHYLRRACGGKRLRLVSPHREAFGNWVASNFSRVGVEDDAQIPRFIDGEPSAEARLAVARQDEEPA